MKTPIPCYCIASPLSNWRRWVMVALVGVTVTHGAGALDFFAEGEKYLSLNNPTKALTYFEAALAQGPPTESLLLDLGLAYQRVGQTADAKRAFQQGAALGGPDKKLFLLNLGIASYHLKDLAGAEEAFSAALTVDPGYADAVVHRANTRLDTKNLSGAAEDYRSYQTLAPNNPQREKIDRLLALLERSAMEAEAARLAEETRKKKEAEEQQALAALAEADRKKAEAEALARRQAEEAAALAEKQRQEEILAQIRESLAEASDDSKTLSTGPSGVKTDDGDFTLEP